MGVDRRGARTRARRILVGAAALLLFILALELMKRGAKGLGGVVSGALDVDDLPSALGFGWLSAYLVMSGSPIAAVSLTLFVNDVLTAGQTFVAIAGSRLGASFVVLLVGFVYHFRGEDRVTSLQMGVLALLVTYSVYLPAIPLGLLLLETGALDPLRFGSPGVLVDAIDLAFGPFTGPLVAALVGALGPAWGLLAVFAIGLAAILGAFHLFDRALPDLDAESPVRGLETHVYRPSVMFAIGLAVTLVTLSVSVSLGILVPLSARGIARRENIVPYIMGANVSTFVDTLFASLLLGSPVAFTIVLAEMASVALLSVGIIAFVFDDYERWVLRSLKLVLRSNVTLAAFMVVIFAVPVVLLLI